MSIPESVIEAAEVLTSKGYPTEERTKSEVRARAVILALAENLPDSAVEKALSEFDGAERAYWPAAMRAAIIAALKDIAGETP